jgi:3-isopropylmalate/(R)-2-methylmalate dehydratase small subunit
MDKFETFEGLVVPLDLADVDTDQILPQRFMKTTVKTGLGQHLFANWRFRPDGSPDPDFVLNQPRFRDARILLARENFGGGSSREHAPWALADYGFRVLIAAGFADIFRNNCLMGGLLTVDLSTDLLDEWFTRVAAGEGYRIKVDLPAQTLTGSDGFSCRFELDPHAKRMLVEGGDHIGYTLKAEAAIRQYEAAHHVTWRAAAAQPGPDWRKAI